MIDVAEAETGNENYNTAENVDSYGTPLEGVLVTNIVSNGLDDNSQQQQQQQQQIDISSTEKFAFREISF